MNNLEMKITNSDKHFSGVKETASKYSSAEKAKLAKASQDFETLMTSMMLKSMKQSGEGISESEEGFGGDVMDGLFQNELASYFTKSRGLGIAGMLYKKLTGEELDGKKLKELISGEKAGITAGADKNDKAPAVKIPSSGSSITPSGKSLNRIEKYDDIIESASKEFGIDKNIIKSVILTESAGNERAQSVAKAKGLMQMLDSTARSMGVKNIWDPRENIYGGTKYLSQMLQKYDGDLKLALAAYNAGPGNVNKYNGVPPFTETRNYITRVMGYLKHFNG